MHGSIKILPTHMNRPAIVYLRQSDPKQVRDHRESAINQRALKERLLELGWRAEQITIVDGDQGRSGASAQGRESFQQMVADVGLGKIGIVIGYDVSRLARNCADWHRLLELCALSDTLIGDSDGIYNPRDFNDRLLLGLKGTMSEAELHSLRLRLDAGRISKAKRGELVHHVPTGLVRDAIGQVVLDPDKAVRSRISLVFSKFEELGSGMQVLKFFVKSKLAMPRKQTSGLKAGQIIWKQPTLSSIHSILKNPAYAGAFVYGRRQVDASKRVGGRQSTGRLRKEQRDWIAIVKDIYPKYISWEQWEKNQAKIKENCDWVRKTYRPSKTTLGGQALLTGVIRCSKCGRAMRVLYKGQRFQYSCVRTMKETVGGYCQYLSGKHIDQAVVNEFLKALESANIDALSASLVQANKNQQDRLKQLQEDVTRLEYAAAKLERQYDNVDPTNRLIACALEERWERALQDLSNAKIDLATASHNKPESKLSQADRKMFADAGKQMPTIWQKCSLEARKKLLRTLVTQVNLLREAEGRIRIRIVWKGGSITEVRATIPVHSRDYEDSPMERRTIERVRELTGQGMTSPEVAQILNDEGYKPCRGGSFTPIIVFKLRHRYGIESRMTQVRYGTVEVGRTTEEMAELIGVKREWIYRKIAKGIIRIDMDRTYGCYLFPKTKKSILQLVKLKEGKVAHVSFQKEHHEG
jgi:DNA invertase Pin-like site-specific DNA recombinase